jgi:hypothetical protein
VIFAALCDECGTRDARHILPTRKLNITPYLLTVFRLQKIYADNAAKWEKHNALNLGWTMGT